MISDSTLLSEIQRLMIEPTVDGGVTWTSGLWTAAEVVQYANQRQQRFIADTCLVGGWFQQAAPATALQTLDQELVYLSHAVYQDAAGVCAGLFALDRFGANLGIPGWSGQTLTRPIGYLLDDTETRSLILVPPPADVGVLHLFGVVLADVLLGTGTLLNIPDEWVPYLRYGIMADMFLKQGDAFDAARGAYCEARWQEGIDSATAVLEAMV